MVSWTLCISLFLLETPWCYSKIVWRHKLTRTEKRKGEEGQKKSRIWKLKSEWIGGNQFSVPNKVESRQAEMEAINIRKETSQIMPKNPRKTKELQAQIPLKSGCRARIKLRVLVGCKTFKRAVRLLVPFLHLVQPGICLIKAESWGLLWERIYQIQMRDGLSNLKWWLNGKSIYEKLRIPVP